MRENLPFYRKLGSHVRKAEQQWPALPTPRGAGRDLNYLRKRSRMCSTSSGAGKANSSEVQRDEELADGNSKASSDTASSAGTS